MVVELADWQDYVLLFLLAAILGGVGGLAFELMQTRRGQTGHIELPHPVPGGRYRDWGVWANIIIGAIAAVAALWIFPPEIETTVSEGTAPATTVRTDIVKVVGLSLIIGSAGSSFLSALQARALAIVKAQEAGMTRQVAGQEIEVLLTEIEAGASHERLAGAAKAAKAAVAATGKPSL